ncbi:MAG: right-handed parallel beta-helix repeat-containing protein, partial [Thermodesulfobacteriota bacterium]|nr:right-handed parallel beta-helix repeat-containing protein [Thermodesulfobacteriota bacterium]
MIVKNTILFQGLLLCLFCLFPYQVFSTNYYLDSANPNSGVGTLDDPWQEISSIKNISSGDAILFKRGGIWQESLLVPSSGITIGSYGTGTQPILDASLPVTGQWIKISSEVYSTPLAVQPGVLLYDGAAKPSITTLGFASVPSSLESGAILLQLDATYSNLWVTSKTANTVSGISLFTIHEDKKIVVRQLTEGREKQWPTALGVPKVIHSAKGLSQPGHWYWADGILYLFSDSDPSSIAVAVGDKPYGIQASGRNNLTIENLTVRGANEVGVFLLNTSESIIRNIRIQNSGSLGHKTGLLLFNSSNNTIIQNSIDSVLKNGIALYAEGGLTCNNTLSGNSVSNVGAAGITLSSDGNAKNISNNIIEKNSISEANTISYDGAGIYTLFAGSNTIRENTITNCGTATLRSAGIMADGSTLPLVIDSNTIRNNSIGGIAVSDSGHQIINNRLEYNGVSSWDNGQILFFPVFAPAKNCTVTGNTMTAGVQQSLLFGASGSTSGHTIDHNTYSSVEIFPFVWSGASMNFVDWKQTTKHDSHSIYTSKSDSLQDSKAPEKQSFR